MRKGLWLAAAAAALLALPLGEVAWALSLQNPTFAWPGLERSQFWALAALVGSLWCACQALGWKLAFSLDAKTGLRIGVLSLLPCALGLFWKLVLRVPLPPPHDSPSRSLQILMAAQGISCLWLALGLGILALKRSGRLDGWAARKAGLRLGGVAFLFFQLNGLWVGQWNMTGDAPHYLLMTHSLAFDGDLDLANNYHHRDWRLFYDYDWDLTPQYPALANGKMLTEHKPGLSILLAPAYRWLQDSGARWTLALLAAAGTGLFYALCLQLGFAPRLALLGWALFGFTAPWMSQSQNTMAEMIGALALLVSLSALRGLIPASTAWASIAFVFWAHLRFTAMGFVLGAFTALKRRSQGLPRAWLPLFFIGLSFVVSLLANRLLFDGPNPFVTRGLSFRELFQPLNCFRYSAGILLDQEFGFLTYTAVFALAPLGLYSLWRRDRPWFWQTLLPALSYFALIGSFPYWWSAMAPNRFMTCLVPVFCLWTLEVWRAWGAKPLFRALAAGSWACAWGMAVLPWLNYSKANGENWVLRIVGAKLHHPLTPYFPSFILNTSVSYVWLAGLALLGLVLWKRLGPPRQG
jgi:hypothetical protein